MSSSKHTPGPWEVLNETEVFTGLGADSGDGVKALPSDGWMIADCGDCVTFTEIGPAELSRDLRRANAKLIAAAPDLLSITQRFLALDSQWHPDRYVAEKAEIMTEARAAVAKATT